MSTKTAPTTETHPVTLDPTVSLPDRIKSGNYAFINGHYTPENFPLTLTGKREIVLFDPHGFVSSKTMIARMKAEGFVPATVDDALAMGFKYPDRQKQNPIVFLGTVFRDPSGTRHVPVLGGWSGGRELHLGWFGGDWRGRYRFAAVREF